MSSSSSSFVLAACVALAVVVGSSSAACDVRATAEAFVTAFQRNHWNDLAKMSEGAARFDNGHLNPATNGHAFTADDWTCISTKLPITGELRALDVSGDRTAVALVNIAVRGSVQPARSEEVTFVLETSHDGCRIVKESYIYGQSRPAYGYYFGAVCQCFPLLHKPGGPCEEVVIESETVDAPPPLDLAARTRDCLQHQIDGNAGATAGCFARDAVIFVNGEPMNAAFDMPATWAPMFDAIKFEFDVLDLVHEGNRVGVVLGGRAAPKTNVNDGIVGLVYRMYYFNDGGEITALHETLDEPLINHVHGHLGMPLVTSNWRGDVTALLQTAIRHFGTPDYLTNVRRGDKALWHHATLQQALSCLDYADVADQGANGMVTTMVTYDVPADRVDDVRDFSPMVVYYEIGPRISVRTDSVEKNFVVMHVALQIARGELLVADADAAVDTLLASIDSDTDALSGIKNSVCSLKSTPAIPTPATTDAPMV